jgi:hypothetical protein
VPDSSGDPRDESRTTNGPEDVLACLVLVFRHRLLEMTGYYLNDRGEIVMISPLFISML